MQFSDLNVLNKSLTRNKEFSKAVIPKGKKKVLYQFSTLMRGNLHAKIMKADWSEELESYLKVLRVHLLIELLSIQIAKQEVDWSMKSYKLLIRNFLPKLPRTITKSTLILILDIWVIKCLIQYFKFLSLHCFIH